MTAPKVDSAYLQGVSAARESIKEILRAEAATPLFIRLAIHDAFAFDEARNTFGANGSIRTQKELAHMGNEGLSKAVEFLAGVKAKTPGISFADLYQLAGVVAIEDAGGPSVKFTPGRKDAWTFPPQSAYLSPNMSDSPLEDFWQWIKRTGLSETSAVALLGLHSIARWWPDQGNTYSFPHATLPAPSISNQYFRQLVAGQVPQDQWLLEDAALKKLIEICAQDEAAFLKDLAEAFDQLSRLGTKLAPATASTSPSEAVAASSYTQLTANAQYAVGAAVVVVIGAATAYGLWRRRRRALRSV